MNRWLVYNFRACDSSVLFFCTVDIMTSCLIIITGKIFQHRLVELATRFNKIENKHLIDWFHCYRDCNNFTNNNMASLGQMSSEKSCKISLVESHWQLAHLWNTSHPWIYMWITHIEKYPFLVVQLTQIYHSKYQICKYSTIMLQTSWNGSSFTCFNLNTHLMKWGSSEGYKYIHTTSQYIHMIPLL